MGKIVLGRLDKIDFRTNLSNVKVLESLENLPEKSDQETIYFAEDKNENINIVRNSSDQLYILANRLTVENKDIGGLHVYFDLENYPFYQRTKQIINRQDNPKGVFRYRRMVTKDQGDSILPGDLYVLSLLFGLPKDIKIKQTDAKLSPRHIITMVNFGEGTMAHIEYTITDQERIEFDWSGIKNIIEFDSDETRPMQPENNSRLPLTYTIDSIISTSHRVDETLINQLNNFKEIINGGSAK